MQRRIEKRPDLVALECLDGSEPQLGGKINQIVFGKPLQLVRSRTCGMRLSLRQLFARHVRGRNGFFLDRPDRLSRLAIEGVHESLLGHLYHRRDVFPIHRYVHE